MTKQIIPFLLLTCCLSFAYANYDRLIGPDEYVYGLDWTSGLLVVDGGGGDFIDVRNFARLDVYSTSTPLGLDSGGIMDIGLTDNAHLNYYGGETGNIIIRKSATANLYGGRINGLTSRQNVFWYYGQPTEQHINIYCQPGWTWLDDDRMKGIEGNWTDGSSFKIEFINHADFDPVWTNINVIIPEPTSLLFLAAGGGILLRRYRR